MKKLTYIALASLLLLPLASADLRADSFGLSISVGDYPSRGLYCYDGPYYRYYPRRYYHRPYTYFYYSQPSKHRPNNRHHNQHNQHHQHRR